MSVKDRPVSHGLELNFGDAAGGDSFNDLRVVLLSLGCEWQNAWSWGSPKALSNRYSEWRPPSLELRERTNQAFTSMPASVALSVISLTGIRQSRYIVGNRQNQQVVELLRR